MQSVDASLATIPSSFDDAARFLEHALAIVAAGLVPMLVVIRLSSRRD